MLYFCENCHMINEQNYCRICGKENLRSPQNDDFCFLIETRSMWGEMMGGILKEENIPYSAIPSGSGVRSYFGLKLENLKIYVPYEFLDKAKELLNDITGYKKDQNND
ncbi:MAG TPA: hypothetical protein VIL26_02110 [Clostridia bacterium]